jgi:Abnormal spindle-like microcephaly-assoc'd, ASPM-SPD-2-Hydin/Galactose oxidase, central domain
VSRPALLAALALALVPAAAQAADVGRFTPLESRLATTRAGGVAAPLPGGRILVAAGFRFGTGSLDTAEIFDPATSAFQPVASRLKVARTRAAAATLKDGRVLIVGGTTGTTPGEKTAEIFDPATNTFSPLTGHDMTRARSGPIAATLPDGRVLVAGGEESGSEATAEIFDPATSTFTAIGAQMNAARADGRAVALADGRILITAGRGQNKVPQFTAEVFDPATGQFTPVADMLTRRFRHVAAPLPDGRVLIAGGSDDKLAQLATAEVYDPAANRWDPVTGNGGEMTTVRHAGMAAPLGDGRILLAGGFEDVEGLDSAELFEGAPDPVIGGEGSFGDQPVGSTSAPRELTVTNRNPATLDVGRVSIEGGDGDFAVATDGCAGAQLGQGQSCTVTVAFSPSDLGPRAAQLTVLDNAPSRVQRMPLAGAGVPARPFTPLQPTGGVAQPELPKGGSARKAAVACVVSRRSGRRTLACLAKAPGGAKVTRFRLKVLRGKRIVVNRRTRGALLRMRAPRALRKGRYTLRATLTVAGRPITATGRLVVR